MDIKLFLFGILLTITPSMGIRVGLPMVLYSLKSDGTLITILSSSLLILINILLILFLFLFLETLHNRFMENKFYKKNFEIYMRRIQKKAKKIERKKGFWVFFSLFLFVSVPIPFTGSYSGTTIAWFLKLNRKKSFISIALGIIVGGIIISILTRYTMNTISF